MAGNFGGNITPREKTILDHSRFKIYGPRIEGAKGSPTFHLFYNINRDDKSKSAPRIYVYTNVESDASNQNGRIDANIDVGVALTFIKAIEKAAATPVGQPFETVGIENLAYVWKQKQRSEKPMPQSTVLVGREPDGRVYISLLHFNKERPRIKFYFGFSQFHKFVTQQDGQQQRAEHSALIAEQYAESVRHHLLTLEDRFAIPPAAPAGGWNNNKGGNGGNGGGWDKGGNNAGGNGGGWGGNNGGSKPSGYDWNSSDKSDSDDQMPW